MKRTNNYINTLHTAFPGRQSNLFIYHSGVIDSQSILRLLAQAENFLYSTGSSVETKRKTIEIMTELLQNIYHHSLCNVDENERETPAFLLEKKGNRFMLTTTNTVPKNNTATLRKQLSDLNSSTPRELTNMYREILKNGNLIYEHAGLGWIDIRRKSGNPILFKFIPKDNNYSLFTVSVFI